MFGSVATALVLAVSVSRVAASPIDHVARNYAKDSSKLEDYDRYHSRYTALNCQDQHDTAFYHKCCHPLLREQKLEDRPAECKPSPEAYAQAKKDEPNAPTIDEDPRPDVCEDEDEGEECEPDASSAAPSPTHPTSTSSSAPAPTHSSPHKNEAPPAPAPEPKHSSSSAAPASTPTPPKPEPKPEPPAKNNGGGKTMTGGTATWFTQNGVAGACGKVHGDNDKIVAMDYRTYGDMNKASQYCGKTVLITNTDNGKTVEAVVADACPSCDNASSLDMSKGTFAALCDGNYGLGVFPIKYEILN